METGIVYAVIAGLFWGTSPVLVKRGLVRSNVSVATLLQQATILITLVGAALAEGAFQNQSISSPAIMFFALAGIIGAYLGRTLFVRSVDQIGAARAQAINNSSPFLTVLLAALLLGEPLTIFVVSGVTLILSGVYFAADSEVTSNGRLHSRKLTFASVLATLCYGVVPVLKKFGTENGASPVLGALIMHATGLVLLLALGSLLKIELKLEKIPLISVSCFVAAGILYALGSIMTLKALVYAPASIVAPIWSAQPVVSFFLAKAALKGIETVRFKDGIAAALVVAGVLVLRLG